MFQMADVSHPQHKASLDRPDLFDYVELSQNSTQTDEHHWERLQWARRYIAEDLRPINHTKTYGGDEVGWTDGADHGIERFWRNVIGGAASCRFHRPPAGIGLSERAQAQIRSARMLLEEINIFRCRPDADHRLLSGRDNDEAYLTYLPGKQYAVYFPQGGSVQLNVKQGSYALKWLSGEGSEWHKERTVQAKETVELEVPGGGRNWCAVVNAD